MTPENLQRYLLQSRARIAQAGYKKQHRREFMPWDRWYDWQIEGFACTSPQVMTLAGNRTGKSQPNQELIPTPDGYKFMWQIEVGDYVFGSDGKPVEVVGVFPQGVRPIYEITFWDGSSARADADHLCVV